MPKPLNELGMFNEPSLGTSDEKPSAFDSSQIASAVPSIQIRRKSKKAIKDYKVENPMDEENKLLTFKELQEKRGLWDNIHAKRARIKHGSGEHMRKPGSKGAPTAANFKAAQEEVDAEGEMAANQLSTAERAAKTLKGKMSKNTQLPAWLQAKITKGSGMLDAASDYMASKVKEEIVSEGPFSQGYLKATQKMIDQSKAGGVTSTIRDKDEKGTYTQVTKNGVPGPKVYESIRMGHRGIKPVEKDPGKKVAFKKVNSADAFKAALAKARAKKMEESAEQIDELSPQFYAAADRGDSTKRNKPKPAKLKFYSKPAMPINNKPAPAMEETLTERGADSKGYFRSTEAGAGLTAKGAAHFRRQNPGSKLSTAVTEKNPKGKRAARRRSFCARMSGMPGPMKDEKGRPTRKAMSLRRWRCRT